MRACEAPGPTIGVSCGHRVPRLPIVDGVRKLYWCQECGARRMSGGKVTGELAFDFLLELRDEISRRELVVRFDRQLEPWQTALVEALGAKIAA